jgi:hypothetical protein
MRRRDRMMEEKKPRQPFTWADVTALGIVAATMLGGFALVIWAFK